jgi:hypothetical protein
MSDYENRLEQGLTQRLNRDSAERENQRLAAVREEQRKRERAAQEAEAKRVADEAAKRRAEFEAQRVAQAKKQAAEDKARERERYLAAGGDPDDFAADWPAIRAHLIAQRIAEQEKRIARPQDYMHGAGGGFTQSLTPHTPPSQQH